MGISEYFWEQEEEKKKSLLEKKVKEYEKEITNQEIDKIYGSPGMDDYLEMTQGKYYCDKKYELAYEMAHKEVYGK